MVAKPDSEPFAAKEGHVTQLTKQTASALEGFDQLPGSAYVRIAVVQALFACSDETVRRRVKAGTIPAPRKLGPRHTAWQVGELRRCLQGLAHVA